jgi:hypothetical protein
MKVVKFFTDRIRIVLLAILLVFIGLISPSIAFVTLVKACNKHQSINGDLGE